MRIQVFGCDYWRRLARRSVLTSCGFFASAIAVQPATAPNLLVNPGFEGSTPAACNGFATFSGGSTAIPGWTVAAGNAVDWNWARSTGPCCDWCPEGDRTVDLNGSPAQNGGAVRQTVATQAGRRYRLSFLAKANGCCSAVGSTKNLQITAGSSSIVRTLTVDGSSDCDFATWQRIEHDWTADSASSLIELRSLVPNNAGGPIVDDVLLAEVFPCPADLFLDYFINGADLGILLSRWGLVVPGTVADLNADGFVNGADLGILLASWGPCSN